MTGNQTTSDESTPDHASSQRPCGHCGDTIGLMPLAGTADFYCSVGCLVFADDFPPESTTTGTGGESR